jgi:hypothetical protein
MLKPKKFDNIVDLTRTCPSFLVKSNLSFFILGHIKQKAAQEPNDAIANFPEIKLACRLLFDNIVAIEEETRHNIPKTAFANFLDALSHAESFRLKILEETDYALKNWHYDPLEKKQIDQAQALSREEVELLEGISKSKDEWRKIFMKILKRTVASVCLVSSPSSNQYVYSDLQDLYFLFISRPWFASDFMARLLEYNPDMFKPTDGREPCRRSFFHLLSDPEIQEIKQVTKQRLQFVKDAHEWLEDNFPECVMLTSNICFSGIHIDVRISDILRGLYSEDFQKAYPPPYELHHLQSLLRYYLGHIRDIWKILSKIFPSQPSQDSVSSQ